jgi:hypothetical protein
LFRIRPGKRYRRREGDLLRHSNSARRRVRGSQMAGEIRGTGGRRKDVAGSSGKRQEPAQQLPGSTNVMVKGAGQARAAGAIDQR